MTENEIQWLENKLESLDSKLDDVSHRVTRIEALLNTEDQRCTYRERIEQAVSMVPRVTKLEDRLVQLEIRVATIGGLAGIVTSVITALVLNAIK